MRTLPPLRALLLTILFSVVLPCVAQEARIVLPAGVVNQAYSQNLSEILKEKYRLALKTSSDTPAYEWRLPGPGPTGLGIDPATGTILGTPTIAKRYLFRVEVLDRSLPQPAPLKLLVSLQITSGEAPVLEQVTQMPPKPAPRQSASEEAQINTDEDVEIPSIVPRKISLRQELRHDFRSRSVLWQPELQDHSWFRTGRFQFGDQ